MGDTCRSGVCVHAGVLTSPQDGAVGWLRLQQAESVLFVSERALKASSGGNDQ